MLRNNLKIAMLTGAVFALGACSGGSGSSSSGGSTPSTTSAITIDNMGNIPIPNGASVTTLTYVSNNSTTAISGITYTEQTNTDSSVPFIDPTSAAACSTIQAGQRCALTIHTPTLAVNAAQGSTSIVASYSVGGQAYSASTVATYSNVLNNQVNGVQIYSGVTLLGAGNKTVYGVVYAFATGEAGQVYTVDSLLSNNPGISICNGDITGKEVAYGSVQAIELCANTSSSQQSSASAASGGYSGSLTLKSTDAVSGQQFTSNAVALVPAAAAGAVLTSGAIPLINTAESGPSAQTGSMLISNSGNLPATSIAVTYPSGVTASTGTNACGTTLAAGNSCSIWFNVTPQGGNGIIQVAYTGSSSAPAIAQTVTWFNGSGGALLQMTATDVTFNATVGGVSTVTVKNVGGYSLANVQALPAPSAVTGSATGTAGAVSCLAADGTTATGTTLPIAGTCTYNITVNDTATEVGTMSAGITGTYNNGSAQTYSRVTTFNYHSLAYAAQLTINTPSSMSIIGNGTQAESQTLTVNSVGNAPATITSSSLSLPSPTMSILIDGCNGRTLESSGGSADTTCQLVVVLGPESTPVTISGTSVYTVDYTGGQTTAGVESASIPWTVQSDQQNISLINVAAVNSTSGTGATGSPFMFSGSANVTAQSIALTYANTGTNAITITGINNVNSAVNWSMVDNCTGQVLQPTTGTCTIVYKNQIYLNSVAVGGLGAVYEQDITTPTIVFTDDLVPNAQFVIQDQAPAPINSDTIRAAGSYATVTSTMTQAAGAGGSVTITHTLANGAGYGLFGVVGGMENYLGTATSALNCTASVPADGTMGQTCFLGNGTTSATITYPINTVYVGQTLTSLFHLNANTQTIGMANLSSSLVLH